MSEEMHAEFDDVAAWTADVALDLGAGYRVPAGCRGSGSPAAMRWFLDRLEVGRGTAMLDAGAGVGGPAAFAAEETAVRPVLSEPEPGACQAARRLFDFGVVQAGSRLPFRTGSFDVAWSLGVLCTVPDQPELLGELRRVLNPDGRLGLLVYVAQRELSEQPAGNNFPTEGGLRELVEAAGFAIEDSASIADFQGTTDLWEERSERVETELERRFGDRPGWGTAQRQSEIMGRLIGSGELAGVMVVARPR
jgi:SAM-dependent methyltransferase